MTAVDDQNSILTATDSVVVSDPIFSADPVFGDARNYRRVNENLWSTRVYRGDLRYFLSGGERTGTPWDGFSFVQDRMFTTFVFQADIAAGSGEAELKSADYKILFGYQDDQNYNLLQARSGFSRVYAYRDGKRTVNGVVNGNLIPDLEFHRLTLVNDDRQVSVFLDGKLVFEKDDEDLRRPGSIGFGSDQFAVYFDEIAVGSPATGVTSAPLPNTTMLHPNYPNPFNSTTVIAYELSAEQFVILTLHNLQGQQIAVLVNEQQSAGAHQIPFDASGLPGGVYIYRLCAVGERSPILMRSGKMLVIK